MHLESPGLERLDDRGDPPRPLGMERTGSVAEDVRVVVEAQRVRHRRSLYDRDPRDPCITIRP